MCGIVAALNVPWSIISRTLFILEEYVGSVGYYRRRRDDSGIGTGICGIDDLGGVKLRKAVCFARDFVPVGYEIWSKSRVVLLHTRWPSPRSLIGSERYLNPFLSCDGRLAVVHNGYFPSSKLYRRLLGLGHSFESHTAGRVVDSECIPHLIEESISPNGSVKDRIREGMERARSVLLKVSPAPGVFAALFSPYLGMGLCQLPMKKGSVLKIWQSEVGERLIVTTWKDVESYYNPDYEAMNSELEAFLVGRGYTPTRTLKNGECLVLGLEDV